MRPGENRHLARALHARKKPASHATSIAALRRTPFRSSASASAIKPLAPPTAAPIIRAPSIMHGKLSDVSHDGQTIFRDLKNPFAAMRYHSLVIDPKDLPEELTVSARTADGVIMAVRHKKFPVEGVQFHPESILAEEGKKLLKNFLECY